LTISDVENVIAVVDSTNDAELEHVNHADVVDLDPDLTSTGNPLLWYWSSGTQLKLWPPSTTVSLTVYYFKVPAELSASGDTPVVPARFHDLIVDGAVIRAYKDTHDFAGAGALQQHFDRRLQNMAQSLLVRSSEPDYVKA
jgi:hypothetical protein